MLPISSSYSVIVVEPDEYRRQRHAVELMHEVDFALSATCRGKREAVAFLNRHKVDLAVLNSVLPDGNAADLIRIILKRNPQAQVLVATDATDDSTVMQMIHAGANGYVLLNDSKTGLASCLRLMLSGGSPVSPTIARSVLRSLHCRNDMRREPPPDSPLSPRELDVIRLLAKGISFAEISSILAISLHTVTTHIKKIYRKLNVHSRGEAVYEARQMGLVD